jgi:hypothetical protein
MDFSQFTGTEQAHMTKVIEKKQVGSLPGFRSDWGMESGCGRSRTELLGEEKAANQNMAIKEVRSLLMMDPCGL